MRRVVDYLDQGAIQWLANSLAAESRAFRRKRFVGALIRSHLADRLFQRADQFARAVHDSLAVDFDAACRIIVAALPPPREAPGYGPLINFRLLPLTRYVSLFGMDHFESSMSTLYEVTKRFTSEFDMRPFLVTHQVAVLRRLYDWRANADLHVRRLVTECTRTRLPWCSHLKAFQRNPAEIVRLIAPMREDASPYVRLSVANNLADILKDDIDRGLQIAKNWVSSSSERGLWVVRHALRYHAYAGDRRALQLQRVATLTLPEIRNST